MSRLKKLASDTAVYGLSSIIGRMLNFLLVPFYSHVFTRSEAGLVNLVFMAFVFLNIVFTYGFESAYMKQTAGPEGRARVQTVFSTGTLSLLVSSLVLGGLIALFPETMRPFGFGADVPYLVGILAATLVVDTLTRLPLAELRMAGRPWYFAVANFANVGVNIALNLVFLLVWKRGVAGVFEANLLSSVAQMLALLPVYAALLRRRFDRSLWREMLAFGLPFVPSGLGYALTDRVSTMGLEKLPGAAPGVTGLDAVGVFTTMMKLGVFMMLVVQMFRFAWQPFFLQHARDADARPLFARVFTVVNAALWGVLLAVSLFAREIATFPLPGGRTLIGAAFLGGVVVVPLALLAYLFQGWYYVFSAGLYIEKQTKYFTHATFAGALVTVAATFALVPRYGIVGAGWVNVLGNAAMAAVLYAYAQRAYRVPWDWPKVVGTAAVAALLFAAWALVPALHAWWAEALLLVAFAAGMGVLGVVPKGLLGRLRRRPARAAAPPQASASVSKAEAEEMADLTADPSVMADDAPDGDATPVTPPAAPDAR